MAFTWILIDVKPFKSLGDKNTRDADSSMFIIIT